MFHLQARIQLQEMKTSVLWEEILHSTCAHVAHHLGQSHGILGQKEETKCQVSTRVYQDGRINTCRGVNRPVPFAQMLRERLWWQEPPLWSSGASSGWSSLARTARWHFHIRQPESEPQGVSHAEPAAWQRSASRVPRSEPALKQTHKPSCETYIKFNCIKMGTNQTEVNATQHTPV